MLYNFIPTSSDFVYYFNFNQLTKIKNRGHFYLKKKKTTKRKKTYVSALIFFVSNKRKLLFTVV